MALITMWTLLNILWEKNQTRGRRGGFDERQGDETENQSSLKTEATRPFHPIHERQWRSSQSDLHRPQLSAAPGVLPFSHLQFKIRETTWDVHRNSSSTRIRGGGGGQQGSFRLHMWAASGSTSANSSWWQLLSTTHAGRDGRGGGQQIVSLSTSQGKGGGGGKERRGI